MRCQSGGISPGRWTARGDPLGRRQAGGAQQRAQPGRAGAPVAEQGRPGDAADDGGGADGA